MKITQGHWDNLTLRVFCKKYGYKIGDDINGLEYLYFINVESAMHEKEMGNSTLDHFHEWLMKKYKEVEE